MPDIAGNINTLRQELPPAVKIVAVSKTRSVAEMLEAYKTGQRIFGENRVQELLAKKDLLPPDTEWHLVGHLQSNKAKLVVSFIQLIHSVDSYRLLKIIDSEALKAGRKVNCLLQFHIAKEESKFGFSIDEAIEMLESPSFSIEAVNICGIMGMATFTDDKLCVREEFRTLTGIFCRLRDGYFRDVPQFKEISMGMSGDYRIAMEEGSTMVRIGSLIFGNR